ncbi:activating signal cointegrator 1 complex subunit 1 isoform X1 [Halyomorpha halys]|uniref:activating signal cointegrator 1 complex subunit 1 isoform X1 n=2 Tax=Halyomorpha halys TaxID=286706 RepID=UPI0006D4DAA0|nr:activating signal cointegrator 1 complex subunit 1 isoform X1 [Halyomorpha halys]
MDVLKPDVFVIEGIRYRVNPGNYESYGEKLEEPYYDNYEELPDIETISDGEEDIEQAEGGRYKTSFHIAMTYFAYIIGSKGATKKRLETETRTKIFIPKIGHSGDIVITGASKKDVASARRRIRLMVISSRKRHAYTHFISVPMTGLSIQSGFMSFKSEVLEKCKDRGINESIFQNPERLHLTIGLLVLSDKVERSEAGKALEECKEVVIKPLLSGKKLRLVMCGIDIMNDEFSDVDILYGKVSCKNDDIDLQDFADSINSFFYKKGISDKNEPVKLHVTLMNTKFGAKKDTEEEEPRPVMRVNKKDKIKAETFDATNIVKNFQDYYFGEENITTIELSTMHDSSNGQGYYLASAVIDIS